MRLLAYFLVILVIGLYGSSGFLYPFFVKAEILVSHVLPLVLRGFASIPTMFNGAFRGDIALLALACFLLDWLFVRLAHLVRS
ncbi:monovalent cation/H+ antiporter subunit G family protein [Atopobium deltae]|uniref:Monovalent cation/H+ antiporter subunit G family protein n=1 Tax=Atopobium deltae TaxID=1393034 RepID=A0A133XS56_9ACTN|nr:monovalent cation/H+ antiporter subunit G family protein [Atopobium deltae]